MSKREVQTNEVVFYVDHQGEIKRAVYKGPALRGGVIAIDGVETVVRRDPAKCPNTWHTAEEVNVYADLDSIKIEIDSAADEPKAETKAKK